MAARTLQSEEVSFSRPAHIPGLELVSARYRGRVFPTHVHDEYVVGAMTMGAETLSIRGETHVAARGDLILIEPGEAHANCAAGPDAFAYSVMYIPTSVMKQALCDVRGDDRGSLPRFRTPTPHLAALHRKLVRTHARLCCSPQALEQESAFLLFLSQLLKSQQVCFRPAAAAPEHSRISRARDYIDAHFRDCVSLRDLAMVAALSPYHLLRSFRRQVGLPPAAYQTQLRIVEAKRLLRQGCGIAETAAEVGFADQSHLSRQFQRIVGTTPGRYAQQ